MKNPILAFFLFLSQFCSAQHVQYTYDASGNRVHRIYSTLRIANPAQPKDSSENVETKYGISIFPNPTSESVNVSISSLQNGETAKVFLYDEQGKVLLMKIQESTLDIINLINLKTGTYYLKIYVKKDSVSYKVVKL